MSAGDIYVLSNPHMTGLVKAGCTTRSPTVRAAELSEPTGVPGRYVVERSWRVADAPAAERLVHAALTAYRLPGSEHFRLPVAAAVERVETILGDARPQLLLHPTWRVAASRAAAVGLLILAYWPVLRRLHRRLRATLQANRH
jgi:hypothetical protein